jgi:hypothetical protein
VIQKTLEMGESGERRERWEREDERKYVRRHK